MEPSKSKASDVLIFVPMDFNGRHGRSCGTYIRREGHNLIALLRSWRRIEEFLARGEAATVIFARREHYRPGAPRSEFADGAAPILAGIVTPAQIGPYPVYSSHLVDTAGLETVVILANRRQPEYRRPTEAESLIEDAARRWARTFAKPHGRIWPLN